MHGFELAPPGSAERRVIDGARECCHRYGWTKTTLDDVADAAGMSRATVYRVFPGGRAAVKDAVRRHDTIVFLTELEGALAGDDLEIMLVEALVTAATKLRDDTDLQFALDNEPGEVLPGFLFRGLDGIFSLSRAFIAPHLERHLPADEAVRVAELLARLVVTHLLEPEHFPDLGDRTVVEALVHTRILPGLSVSA